ncbi:LAMI_0G16094g1_1 [Lachancea mirantina]|uniref:Serine/threonine-protein kinase BUR1 n=1 Tax=Lachancea mirantina TaxID=1230905 RepID=A0A1G4KCQ0_9SACH|nr:LAMI_0G16094g1_1 [Lachancea mirantina]
MSQEVVDSKRPEYKYKIGKVKQTPTVQKDDKTGLDFIELKARLNAKVYGCTAFSGIYKEEKKLGQGTFGEVYMGVHLETQRQVAMKRIIVKAEKDLFPITAQREIMILRKLNHKNVIKLIEMVYDYPPSQSATNNDSQGAVLGKSFYMILPYMVSDLSGILHNPRISLQMADIKNILLQILEGMNYIHCQKYMHRDIKTANLLIDHKGILKIADFGLARNYYGAPPNQKYPGGAGVDAKYTSVVVTRWYRAPELVLGDKNYTTAIDMWGVGCVFAELFEKKPILQGQTDIDQGHVIFKLMGTPSEEIWALARYLPGAELTATSYTGTIADRFGPHLSELGLDLLKKLLALDPYKRLTAMAAQRHAFFTEEPLPAERLLLPCEECHEADIKRYKQEQNRSLSQQPPAAPAGHIVEKDPLAGGISRYRGARRPEKAQGPGFPSEKLTPTKPNFQATPLQSQPGKPSRNNRPFTQDTLPRQQPTAQRPPTTTQNPGPGPQKHQSRYSGSNVSSTQTSTKQRYKGSRYQGATRDNGWPGNQRSRYGYGNLNRPKDHSNSGDVSNANYTPVSKSGLPQPSNRNKGSGLNNEGHQSEVKGQDLHQRHYSNGNSESHNSESKKPSVTSEDIANLY